MSLKEFFQKEEQAIADFFHTLADDLKNKWLPAVLAIVEFGRDAIDLDAGDIIGQLVGKAGVAVEDKIRIVIDSITFKLQACQQFINAGTSEDVLTATLKYLGTQAPDAKSAFWIEFAARVSEALADGQISYKEALSLLNYVEKNKDA